MKREDSRVLRYMFLRTVAPSMLIIIIATLGFAFFSNLFLRREMQSRIGRMETSLSTLEGFLDGVNLDQHRLLSSTRLKTLVNMYDDIDWYNRYYLQEQLQRDVVSIYDRYDFFIDGVYLIIPKTGRVVSNVHIVSELPGWLHEAELPDAQLVRIDGGRIAYAVRLYDLDDNSETACCIVQLNEQRFLDLFRQPFEDLISNVRILLGEESGKDWDLCLDGRAFSIGVNFRQAANVLGESASYLMRIVFAFLLISLLVNILCIAIWFRQVYIPLRQLLIEAFGETEAGNLGYRISTRTDTPFASIFASYNHMMERMEKYVEKELQQQILVSRANLKQLQAQINPHFLYNSYYTLYRLIKRGDRENSMRMANYLGQFFQYVTRNAEDEKKLKDEVAHARTYAQIQRIRFGDMLDVRISDPDEAIAEVYVPRLILQPLLENAFKYVYDTQAEDTMVLSVSFCVRSASDFDILVENSGSIGEDVLRNLQTRIESIDDGVETTALINIHRRLKLFFGPASGLCLSRSSLGGLCVCMHIQDEREET